MASARGAGSTSSRRGFLRHLIGEVGNQLGQLAGEAGPVGGGGAGEGPSLISRPPLAARSLPSRGAVTVEDAVAIADACGLSSRLGAVRALAWRSVRLTLGDTGGATPQASWLGDTGGATPQASWLGDPRVRPDNLAWSGEQEPRCLAGIDLAQAAAVLGDDDLLPFEGTLWCFAPPAVDVVAQRGDSQVCPVVVHTSERMPAAVSPPLSRVEASSWRSVELSAELQLPRVWSDAVQALDLDDGEHDAWQRLRQLVAGRQGVEVHDGTHGFRVMHRLLGYPDERRGDMPLACELLARGHVLGDEPPRVHQYAAEAEPHTGRWRLLLQLSIDDELGWSWGGRRERLYVWVDEGDLAIGDFAHVRAFAQ